MNLPDNRDEQHLFDRLTQLNLQYSQAVKHLTAVESPDEQLLAVEQLIPIVSQAMQTAEQEIGMNRPEVQEMIEKRPKLKELADRQRKLVKKLLSEIKKLQSEFSLKKSSIGSQLDSKAEHNRMQQAYRQSLQTEH